MPANLLRQVHKAVLCFVAVASLWRAATAAEPPFDPTDRYAVRQVEGWTVRVNDRFAGERPQLLDDVLAELRKQLIAVEKAVPAPAVEKLRRIEIWVEVDAAKTPCMCYHGHEGWLRANNVNPAKTDQVELGNARNFLSWTRQQPWMVLHELAHGYHDRFLDGGFENRPLAAAWAAAKESGRYGEVKHVAGGTRDHYAATNPMEYFAEGTEAYFGKNDFFPYDNAELKDYDPRLCALLGDLWGAAP